MSEKASKLQFNAYEYIGVIAPGAVLSLGLIVLWPETKNIFFNNDFTVGELGLFVIIAYVVGHLLQSIGNLVEKVLWCFFGEMPTNWVLNEKQNLISSQQRAQLESIIKQKHNVQSLHDIDKKQWYPVVREMYIDIEKENRTGRIDSFNRTYGLLRGVASAFLVLAAIVPVHTIENWRVSLWILALGFLPSLFRMFRFGKNYGREILVEYIRLAKNN